MKTAFYYCSACNLGFRHFKNPEEAWKALLVHQMRAHRAKRYGFQQSLSEWLK